VVAVRWGTRPEQQRVRTTLAELGAVELEAPVTMVIGAVAAVDVGWFEDRSLFGRRVVVTRAREQASELSALLTAAGAAVVEVPAIVVEDPSDGGDALRATVGRLGEYAWVVFTSANAVERFFACVDDARALGGRSVAAIGPGTAEALRRAGINADLVPERFVAEALLATCSPTGSAPKAGTSTTSPPTARAAPRRLPTSSMPPRPPTPSRSRRRRR
jgi:uroporphyrinogen III methyltransferase/synthase